MTDRVSGIVDNLNLANEDTVSRALNQTAKFQNLTDEEKKDLTIALTTIFYHHDHAGVTSMNKLAVRAEKQIAKFGDCVLPILIEELINADADSADYLGRTIAMCGDAAIDEIIEKWYDQWEDDFAIINFIHALAYFKSSEVSKAIPQIIVAAKAQNFQLRAIALYAIGKLSLRLPADAFDEKVRILMFETMYSLLSDPKPLVRKNAARALGKMLKKGLLDNNQQRTLYDVFLRKLGKDGQHKWDRAFIVRHEAEHFMKFFKISDSFADKYKQSFRIITKKPLCKDTFLLTIEVPYISRKIRAGQFLIIRPNVFSERIPISVYAWNRRRGTIKIIVTTIGKTSAEINNMNIGDCFSDVVGPLGKRSHVDKYKGTCVVMGGGYGTGAIIPTALDLKNRGNKVIGIVGARSKDLLIMVDQMEKVCDEVIVCTNDGSRGVTGFVTEALSNILDQEKISYVLAIGPVPMMKAVSEMTRKVGCETYVSLNAIMVDGTGMCGACRVTVGGKTKFACFHGPDFDGHKVDFEELVKRQKMFVKSEKKSLKIFDAQ